MQPAAPSVGRGRDRHAQRHVRVAATDLPALEFRPRLVTTVAELEQLAPAWERLVETAMCPNPFFDPDFLIPAFEHLGDGAVEVVVVEAPKRQQRSAEPVLVGLFPVVRRRLYKLPVSCFEVWKHEFCFNTTPLLRDDCAYEALEAAMRFMGEECGVALWSLVDAMGEGPFQNLVTEICHDQDRSVFLRRAVLRAEFRAAGDADTYLRSKTSSKTRKNTQRLARRLSEAGPIRVEVATPDDAPDEWSDDFLELESLGWRSAEGTAMRSKPATERFFRDLTERSLPKSKMTFLRLRQGDATIASMCDMVQRDDVAHFRTAYDERLASYSPGLQLELANVERMHEAGVQRADSCADPGHSMINRVWGDRVRMQSSVIAVGGELARAVVAALPLLQALGRFARTARGRS